MLKLSLDEAPKAVKLAVPELPAFATHKPDFGQLSEIAARFEPKRHIILIGRGGSTASAEALWKALGLYKLGQKQLHFLTTTDPDYITYLKRLCKPGESAVIVVSKSGETIDVLEDLLAFRYYETLIMTSPGSTLAELAAMRKSEIIEHPELGGRYAGCTEVGLLPIAAAGIDPKPIWEGAQQQYARCAPSREIKRNAALALAARLAELEQRGYTEVLAAIYCHALKGFAGLITQLMHESVCKEGKGQSWLVFDGPQWQHHTSQRLFGGRRNMALILLRVTGFEHESKIELSARALAIKKLAELEGLRYSQSLAFEAMGVAGAATATKIPYAQLLLDRVSSGTVGALMAFLHYLTYYSALLRGVNPFDQPAVEEAKVRSAELRHKFGRR